MCSNRNKFDGQYASAHWLTWARDRSGVFRTFTHKAHLEKGICWTEVKTSSDLLNHQWRYSQLEFFFAFGLLQTKCMASVLFPIFQIFFHPLCYYYVQSVSTIVHLFFWFYGVFKERRRRFLFSDYRPGQVHIQFIQKWREKKMYAQIVTYPITFHLCLFDEKFWSICCSMRGYTSTHLIYYNKS